MKKSRIEKLIPIANNVLLSQYEEVKKEYDNTKEVGKKKEEILDKAILRGNAENKYNIKSNYDGKIAGFGVSVAISGLKPTLAMYFNESGDVKTRPILEAIAKMIVEDKIYLGLTEATAKGLLEHALNDATKEKELKKYVLEAAIALKLIVRTYEQEKKAES